MCDVIYLLLAVLCLSVVRADDDQDEVGTPLIAGGFDAPASRVPWNAGLFRPAGSSFPGSFDHICGGSLVTPSLVISAAMGNGIPHESYKIALGKYSRDWAVNEVGFQRKAVKRAVLHGRFRGAERHWEHDICVIELSTPAALTATVQVVQAVWTDELKNIHLINGNVGVIAGWGKLQSGENSINLRSLEIPYVDAVTCENSVERRHKKLVTQDKFCAGFINESKSVCEGDSGAGLVFKNPVNNRTYLGGVASVAFRESKVVVGCTSNHYVAFTDVSEHYNQLWLKTLIKSVDDVCVTSPCGQNTVCTKQNQRAVCNCKPGYTGDPFTRCSNIQSSSSSPDLGNRYGVDDVCVTSPCGQNTVCTKQNQRAVCNCKPGYTGDPFTRCSKTASPAYQVTPPGYKLISGVGTYKFHTDAATWSQANRTCAREGGHLAIINSRQEANAVASLIASNGRSIVGAYNSRQSWVGVKESDTEDGEYFTIFGEPLSATGYTRWAPGQPNNQDTLGDVVLFSTDAKLIDWSEGTGHMFSFVCELSTVSGSEQSNAYAP